MGDLVTESDPMKTRLEVDTDTCILSGECVYNHPDYFAWATDDNAVLVTRPEIESDDDLTHAEQAIEVCPARAISLVTTT